MWLVRPPGQVSTGPVPRLRPTGGVCREGAPESSPGPAGRPARQLPDVEVQARRGVPPPRPTRPRLLPSHFPAPPPVRPRSPLPGVPWPTSAPGTPYGNPPLRSSGPPLTVKAKARTLATKPYLLGPFLSSTVPFPPPSPPPRQLGHPPNPLATNHLGSLRPAW